MPERKLSRAQEHWNSIRQQIERDVAGLLEQGRVLTTPDVIDISSRHGYSPRSVINPTHFYHLGEEKDEEGYYIQYIGPVRIVEEKVHGYITVRSAEIPVEQTDFETVSERLKQQVQSRHRPNFPWLQQEKPE